MAAWAFDLNSPLLDHFVLRVARSLLHKETRCGFVDCEVSWALNPDHALKRELIRVAKTRRVSDEFVYSGLFRPGEINSGWLFTLYGSIDFLASLFKKGQRPS